jgi:cell division protein ZapA
MESGATERPPVRVTIFHQTYTLRSSGNEQEIQELADSVDQLMSAIASKAANADSLRVAVLACLHLADRLRTLERELNDLKTKVGQKSHEFRLLLDQVIESAEALKTPPPDGHKGT